MFIPKWLKEKTEEITEEDIKMASQADESVKSGEKVIGEVPEETRKLVAVYYLQDKKMREAMEAMGAKTKNGQLLFGKIEDKDIRRRLKENTRLINQIDSIIRLDTAAGLGVFSTPFAFKKGFKVTTEKKNPVHKIEVDAPPFLDWVTESISEISIFDVDEPEKPIKPSDTPLGELGYELVELYGLYLQEVNRLNELFKKKWPTGKARKMDLMNDPDYSFGNARIDTLRDLFWLNVEINFNTVSGPETNLGLRQKFTVVKES